MVSQAIVLSSAFSTRICRTVAVARAVGISALTRGDRLQPGAQRPRRQRA